MVGLLAGSVFASESRSGSALVLLELIVLCVFVGESRKPKVRLAIGAVILVFVALGAAIGGWERLWVRLHDSDNTRIVASITSLEMIRRGPIAGYGLGTWPTVYPMFAHFDDGLFMNQAHNDWLQWAVEGGWPLAMLLACLAARISVPALRSGWGFGIPAVLLLCSVDFPLQKPAVSILLFALAGAAETAGRVAPPQPRVLNHVGSSRRMISKA
jgi:O-antigen ligase